MLLAAYVSPEHASSQGDISMVPTTTLPATQVLSFIRPGIPPLGFAAPLNICQH